MKYRLFLIVVGCCMLCLNLLDAPTLSDDILYRFMWNADQSDPVKTINDLDDLITSQWTHYLTTNGRWLMHLLAQAFLVFVSPVVMQVVNTLLYVFLLYLIARSLTADRSQWLVVSVVSCFLLFAVFQGFRTTMVWSLGAFNYLWPLVITLLYLLFLRRVGRQSVSVSHLLLSPLALLAGATHEALSLPVSIALVAYVAMNRRRLMKSALTPYVLWYALGTATILLSPGFWVRTADGVSLMSRLFNGAFNLVFNMRVLWLLLLALIMQWRRNRSWLRQHLRQNVYVYLALVASLGIVVLCGTNLERVCFFTDFIAMMLLLQILLQKISRVWLNRLTTMVCLLMACLFVAAYVVRRENYDSWLFAREQMETPGRELIAVKLPVKGESLLMDYFRSHYVNPSFEFGFYCVYMGFDANDINIRCAARLFGKERMVFLPEDVVSRIESDTTAYQHYELSADQSLYVWQLPRDSVVSTLRFVLNAEDVSQLLPHQRLLSYKDDTYDLDDFNFEVVEVAGRPYLVFTKPTTNIFRRINHVELE